MNSLFIIILSAGLCAAERPKYLSPIAIVKSPDETTLYIANQTGRTVQYVETATCKIINKVELSKDLTGIGISPNGKTLFVTSRSHTGEVFLIDVKEAKLKVVIDCACGPALFGLTFLSWL